MLKVIVGFLFLTCACLPGKDINIGGILSFTEVAGEANRDVRNGMLLAENEINASGGINGRNIKIVIKDSRLNISLLESIFNDLEKNVQPIAYISSFSLSSTALMPFAEQSEVPLLGVLTGGTQFAREGNWSYRFSFSAGEEVKQVLKILEKTGLKELTIFHSREEWGMSLRDSLKELLKKTESSILLREISYPLNTTDFSTYVDTLMAASGIYGAGFSNKFIALIKLLKEKGYKGILIGTNAFSNLPNEKRDLLDGMFCTAPVLYKENYSFAEIISRRYRQIYSVRMSHYSAIGYDVVKMIAALLEDTDITRKNLNQQIQDGFIYSGLLGAVNLQKGGRSLSFPLYPVRIEKGKITYLE